MIKSHSRLFVAILVALIFGVALYFRVVLPYDSVFTSAGVKFSSVDAYWHMRIVDNLLHNFPHLLSFDPYAIFPNGEAIDRVHFFDWFLAGIIKLVSFGSPTESLIDTVAAYFPAVLGALVVVPVYFIGAALINRWAGVIAAALVAVLPGEFLGRSIIGFTDHHVAESLFSAVAMMFLVLALKAARDRGLSLAQIKARDWKTLRRPLLFSLLAGVSLGIYMITWTGSLLFVFLATVYFVLQFVIDHVRGKSVDYLWITGVPFFLVPRLMVVPFSESLFNLLAPMMAILILVIAAAFSWLLSHFKWKPGYYPAVLAATALLGAVIFRLLYPERFGSLLEQFSIFAPTGPSGQTTLEMQGLLYPGGSFSWEVAWGNFNVLFFVSILMLLGFVVYIIARRDTPQQNLVLIWSLGILASTLGQRRFGYYLAVNVALLSGYAFWLCLWYAGFRSMQFRPAPADEPAKRRPRAQKRGRTSPFEHAVVAAIVGMVVLFPAMFWCITASSTISSQSRFAPSDGWSSALAWLKQSTPDPLGEPDSYYKEYDSASFKYPPTAYGVTAWWDYGYWITHMGHRIPSANPGQSPEPIRNVARLFLSEDEASAREAMLKLQSSYVIIDYKTVSSIFWAIAVWGGHAQEQYSDIFFTAEKPQDTHLVPVRVYYPDYYRTLVARLFNFEGKAVTTEKPLVVVYKDTVVQGGQTIKQVTEVRSFASYADAQAFASSQKGATKAKVANNNPFASPVALEALKSYSLAYSSPATVPVTGSDSVPDVKIFEFSR